jgi:DNA-directed RNA polymerase subunit RPC12/RpoP
MGEQVAELHPHQGRLLVCTRCKETVHVYEAPTEFIDPMTYVCGQCLRPVDGREGHEEDPDHL